MNKKTKTSDILPPLKTIILIAGRSPLEEPGGGHSAYVRTHAYAATAAGYEVHLFALSNTRSDPVDQPYGTVHHTRVDKTPIRQRYIQTLAAPLTDSICRQESVWSQADCIHSFGLWSEAGARTVQALNQQKSLRHIINLYTIYKVEVWEQLKAAQPCSLLFFQKLIDYLHVKLSASRFEAENYHRADRVVVNYDCVKKLVTNTFGPHPNLSVLPYSPEFTFLQKPASPKASKPEVPHIVTVALQRPKKGIHILLKALRTLNQRSVRFTATVAGSGESRDRNIRMAKSLGLSDIVTFPGYVENLPQLFEHATVYVQPSIREESGSLAVLEAMASGCAVICSDVDGLAEDVRNGQDGITIAPGNPEKLADAIEGLLNDDEKRSRLGRQAIARFESRHSRDLFVSAVKSLYKDTI